jgi:hypothetical protein
MYAMRQRSLPIILRDTSHRANDEPFPVFVCAAVILGISAGCYFLLFRLIDALGFW